jgi:hypothetical protein
MEYTEFSVGGTPSIGMMPKPAGMPAEIPSYWMPYFQVASADTSAAKAQQLGGKLMVPPQDIPNTGRFAIVTDPQGAMFAVYQVTAASAKAKAGPAKKAVRKTAKKAVRKAVRKAVKKTVRKTVKKTAKRASKRPAKRRGAKRGKRKR